MKLLVEKIHTDAKEPVRANPTDSGADVFVYDFKKKYVQAMAFPDRADIITLNETETPEPEIIEYCIHDGNDEENILKQNSLILMPMERVLIGTGIKVIPLKDYEIYTEMIERLVLEQGFMILYGVVDSDRELEILLVNMSMVPKKVEKGQSITRLKIRKKYDICLL